MHRVTITAPSRLHFGLWSLAGGEGRQFGGVGVMVDQPGLQLTLSPAAKLSTTGPLAERIQAHRAKDEMPDHVGLGTGTQLALAVAAGLCEFHRLEFESPPALAASVSRGMRSAVGTYGFLFGGLIAEQGKLPDEPISPLDCRLDLPAAWRFVLVRPFGIAGLAGEDEAAAIGDLPAVRSAVTDELMALAYDRLLPAAVTADFPAFADATHHYCRLAGEIFA